MVSNPEIARANAWVSPAWPWSIFHCSATEGYVCAAIGGVINLAGRAKNSSDDTAQASAWASNASMYPWPWQAGAAGTEAHAMSSLHR